VSLRVGRVWSRSSQRLEIGAFTWPQSGDAQGKVILSREELSLLLGGMPTIHSECGIGVREPIGTSADDANQMSCALATSYGAISQVDGYCRKPTFFVNS
jgi:hypothetical protein